MIDISENKKLDLKNPAFLEDLDYEEVKIFNKE